MRLTAKQLENRDPGSGMAVVDRDALPALGASSGNFVAIEGREGGRTVARVWPSDRSDAGRGVAFVDTAPARAATCDRSPCCSRRT
jgi:transitional endoplasmic reticulum ATPase